MFRDKPFIVAISPYEANCKKLRKDTRKQVLLYMGTLSLEEALEMRSSCYPSDVTEQLVRSRYNQIGGIARVLTASTAANNYDSNLQQAIEKQTMALQDIAESPLRIDGGEVMAQFKNLWSLYHLQPVSPGDNLPQWYSYTIEPCCSDMRVKIRDRLMKKDVEELLRDLKIQWKGMDVYEGSATKPTLRKRSWPRDR
mmetsp:Transcript_17336/g.26260  ORF Transcript_17336/g.26260 Transcript_17336/m.26260 type:complete len:197 (-) Transcript_17336:899-1489(-)